MGNVQNANSQLQNVVILRSFAIVMVVLYHCYCPWLKAWDWFPSPIRPLYSFVFECILVGRMPLFVTVSGYLFSHLFLDRGKYATFGIFITNKIRRLLLPCLLFLALMCLCLQSNYLDALIGYGYHLWFLKMLFLSFMVCWPLLKYVHGKWDLIFLGISIIMAFTPSIHFFAIEQFQKYFMFFYGGALLYKYRDSLNFLYTKKWIIVIGIIYLILILIVLWRYIVGDAYGDIIHTDRIVVIIRLVLRIVSIVFAFCIVDYYIKGSGKTYSFLMKFNKMSFGIYLFHLLYIEVFHKYLPFGFLNDYPGGAS